MTHDESSNPLVPADDAVESSTSDNETLGKMSLFLGVMMGVGGAASSLTTFAKQVARPALQKQIAQQTLTKTAWYGPMKQTLKLIGIKISKDSFAKGVTRTVPVIGGVISGGMTLVALRSQSTRLQKHLRELPPPGVDAAQYLAALDDLDAQADEPGALAAAQAKVKGATGEAAARVRGMGGSLLRKAHRRPAADNVPDGTSPVRPSLPIASANSDPDGDVSTLA